MALPGLLNARVSAKTYRQDARGCHKLAKIDFSKRFKSLFLESAVFFYFENRSCLRLNLDFLHPCDVLLWKLNIYFTIEFVASFMHACVL